MYSSSDTSSTRKSGLALSKGVDTSVSSALDSESRALDAGEKVVGVVRLLSRGADGGDAREEPVDCGETWSALSLRKASKSKSRKGSLLAGVVMLKGWRVILGPKSAGGGRRGKKSRKGGGAMGIAIGGGGGGGGYGMPVKLYGENLLSDGRGGGNGGWRPMLLMYGQTRGIVLRACHGLVKGTGSKAPNGGGGGGGGGGTANVGLGVKGFGKWGAGLGGASLSKRTRRGGGGESERSGGGTLSCIPSWSLPTR